MHCARWGATAIQRMCQASKDGQFVTQSIQSDKKFLALAGVR